MTLQTLLKEEMVLTTSCASKEALFQELCERIVAENDTLTSTEILQAFNCREAEMTTGIGLGVAIPHGRLSSLEKPTMVFLKHEQGLYEYGTLDGRPVHFVFGLLTPLGSETLHCKILQEVSSVLGDVSNREKILAAHSSKDIYSILLRSSSN